MALPMSGSSLTAWQIPVFIDDASAVLVPVIRASGVTIVKPAENPVSVPDPKPPPPW